MPAIEPIRLNRYLALAGLGTRRSVERLIASGRIAIDGTPARDPALRVAAASEVTLDGNALETRGPAGLLLRWGGGSIPPLPHPAQLHEAGRSTAAGVVALIDDESLATRLRQAGYDPGRLAAGGLADGAFRPLSPAELEAARVYAARSRGRR